MYNLSIVWWNTSLYSYAPKESARSLAAPFCDEVYAEMQKLCFANDIVFLGECPKDSLMSVEDSLNANEGIDSRYRLENLYYKNKSLEFHNAVIFRCDKFELVEESNADRSITRYRNIPQKRHYRVAQRVRFRAVGDMAEGFEFYIVHWSKRNSSKGELEEDNKLGSADEILARVSNEDIDFPYKMVLGDFNKEPYELTLRKLNETRSRDYAIGHSALYNPFWKLMHEENGTICSPDNENFHCNKPFFDFCLLNERFCKTFDSFMPEIITLDMEHRPNEHRPVKITISNTSVYKEQLNEKVFAKEE